MIHRPGREELGHDASQSYRICLDRLLEALASLEPDVRSAVEAQFLGSTAEADNTRQSALPDCSVARLFRRGVQVLRQRLLSTTESGPATDAVLPSDHEDEVDQVVASYLEALSTSCPLDRDELLAAHPDLADELSRFFAGYGVVYLWFGPLAESTRDEAHARTVADQPAGESHFTYSKVRVDRYVLLDVLGGGGQGVVYKVLQRGAVERPVALKTLRTEGLATKGHVTGSSKRCG